MPKLKRNISQRSEMVYDIHEFGVILDTREIFLCDNVSIDYDNAEIDHIVLSSFIKNLQILNIMGRSPILVHMMSVGGSIDCGMGLFDAIKNSCDDPKLSDITVLAYSQASSMSLFVPQAATWRVIMPSAFALLHYGTTSTEGNISSIISDVRWVEKQRDFMLDIYIDRCKEGKFWKGMEEKEIKEWFKKTIGEKQEVYFTAREAVEKGFMDAVLGDEGFETLDLLRET